MTVALIVLAVVVGWFAISAVTAYLMSAVVRGGAAEDEVLGYVETGAVAEAREAADDPEVPSPRRTEDGMGGS